MANTIMPENIVKAIQKETDRELGKKDDRNWANGLLRSIFNQHIGALVCRNCGYLNVPDAVFCGKCGLSHEIAVFVGIDRPTPVETIEEPQTTEITPLVEFGSILEKKV